MESTPLKLAIIGAGKPWKSEGATGFGMSHRHMQGYQQCKNVTLVAVADIVEANAKAFAEQYGGAKAYTDYKQMLQAEKPDVVSIATWPHLHYEMVVSAAEAGAKLIHCEKPISPTFGEARKMVDTCQRLGVQLTFNHQRRFNLPFRKAKELLDSGAIGKLLRIEGACGNLFDWGTHWFDMMNYINNDVPAKWVIGQIDLRETQYVFGAPCEGQGLSHIKFNNGVHGLMITGYEAEWEAGIRIIGGDGVIEIDPKDKEFPNLRLWNKNHTGWQKVEVEEDIHGSEANARGVCDLIEAYRSGREPELSAARAMRATELIFATYESSRRRGRVDLPLEIEDSPLIDMLAQCKKD